MNSAVKFFTVIAAVLYLSSCNNSSQSNDTGKDDQESSDGLKIESAEEANKDIPEKIAGFVLDAYIESMAYMEISKEGLKRVSDVRVNSLMQDILTTNTQFYKELSEIGESKNIVLPLVMDKDHQEPFEKVKKTTSSAEFHKEFLDLLVDNLRKSVKLYEDAEKSIEDVPIKRYISKTLPTIRRQAQQAESLQ